jgi:S1-C subfamily serine protease
LALLRLKGYKTPYIPRGNAHGLHHGQPLYAIGNSLDMGHTVTSGIFSGRRADLLQTNAQINPGNSGGPLITEDGRVIGINTSKVVHSSVEGVGFAIPIHVVMTEFGAYIGM